MARMHDHDRRPRRHWDDDDDDRERRRGAGGGYDPYDAREAWPPGYGGPNTASGRHAYGYGGATSGSGRRSRRDDDEDYERHGYGRYGGGHDRDDERSRGSLRRGAAWYGANEYDRYAGGGRYGASYGATRRSGLYGDDDAASGGSIPRGRQHAGYGSESMGMSAGLQRGMGSMAGKGPKGYVRSDERIREDVCDCLTDDPHLDASSIEVEVKNGEVTLSGTVDSREAKRHAEELIDRVSGVKDVQNSLRVQDASRSTEGGGKGKRGDASNPGVGPTS
jgi:BON domain